MTDLVDGRVVRRKAASALAVPLPAALGAELIDSESPAAGVFKSIVPMPGAAR